MPEDKCVSLQESEGHRERTITAEWTRIAVCEDRCLHGSLPTWIAACEDRCLRESLPARIAACDDRCLRWSLKGQQLLRSSVGVWENTQRLCIPTCCHTWKRVGKTLGPCVAVLCVDVDTDDRTAFILHYYYPPRNWYCKIMQILNRMTDHYSPESTVGT